MKYTVCPTTATTNITQVAVANLVESVQVDRQNGGASSLATGTPTPSTFSALWASDETILHNWPAAAAAAAAAAQPAEIVHQARPFACANEQQE
ncbi:hypothetical protein T4A_10065, partial [Trichinella pseudospiralis]